MVRIKGLVAVYYDLKDYFPLFIRLYRRIKKEGLDKEAITDLLENETKLIEIDKRVMRYNDFIKGQQSQKLQLEQEINWLRKKRDNYDGILPL